MARQSATAALLLFALSLLAVGHCRALAADHDTEPESTAAVAVSDDNVLSDPTVHAEAGAASATEEEALPAEQQHGFELLRLPSHRLHHHHHHLWWKRHHGIYRDASRRFPCSGHGARREAVSHLAILPASAEAARDEAGEVMPVAEPDPDRSLPDSDGEGEVATSEPSSFADADGHGDESAAAARAWKKEMLRRWFHFHFHHGMRHHRLHHVQHEEEEEATTPETESTDMKRHRFHFHHHDEEDEEKNMARKRLRHADEHDEDSDDEDEQVEEMVRRFRKAIMRRRFGHGRRSHFFHHIHRHAEEAKKQADVEEEESGVLAWIKGLMNRF